MGIGILLIKNSNKKDEEEPFDVLKYMDENPDFFNDNSFLTVPRYDNKPRDVPYGFSEYENFTVGNFANIGGPQSKNRDDCSFLCSNTAGCTGFTFNNNVCQLKNNVVILERSRNSIIYASNDIGGVQYLNSKFAPIIAPGSKKLYSISGQLGDAVSNCTTNKRICSGFLYNSSTSSADMYGQGSIVGLDSTRSGDTYVSINNKFQFIKEGNYEYTDKPSDDFSWTVNPNWTFPYNNGEIVLPTNDNDFFAVWRTSWDAGYDSFNKSNTMIVSSLSHCQNACVTNTWCQSFVYSNSAKTCHLRKDRKAQYFPERCRSQASADACVSFGPCSCPCGCAGSYPAKEGIDDNTKTTYIKKEFPIEISCPLSCSRNGDCKMVTFDDTKCNMYTKIPKNRRSNNRFTSVWNFDNFPN